MDSSMLLARRVDSNFSLAEVRSVARREVEEMGWDLREP
jgi:hypothetical protein